MAKLPYIQLERELHYNLGVLLLVIDRLAQTKRNKKILTIDRIQTFYFLVTKPVFLNKVLSLADKKQIDINSTDYFTVNTLAVNVDELYDRKRLQAIIKILSLKNYILAEYSASEGFVFSLNEIGKKKAEYLNDGYFKKIDTYLTQLSALQSQSSSKLNSYINTALKQGI